MDAELDAIFTAWDKNSGGRDETLTRSLSDDFVAAHPELFSELQAFGDDLDRCVQSLEVFRAAGWRTQERLVQVWLWHTFAKQEIGGEVVAKLRFPNQPPDEVS